MEKGFVVDSILTLLEDAEIVSLTNNILLQSIESSSSDFEDAIQYYSAISKFGINFIVTRDPKGFKNSELPIYDTKTAINILKHI